MTNETRNMRWGSGRCALCNFPIDDHSSPKSVGVFEGIPDNLLMCPPTSGKIRDDYPGEAKR